MYFPWLVSITAVRWTCLFTVVMWNYGKCWYSILQSLCQESFFLFFILSFFFFITHSICTVCCTGGFVSRCWSQKPCDDITTATASVIASSGLKYPRRYEWNWMWLRMKTDHFWSSDRVLSLIVCESCESVILKMRIRNCCVMISLPQILRAI